jgi:photosystem II stability/assembly factor-like uncharacterized protein
MADKSSTDVAAADGAGSMAENWPGWLVSLLVVSAALFSFSPRPSPEFAPTTLRSDQMLVTDVIGRAQRLVAVGEQGHILYADSTRGPWRQARVEPGRGSTLTRVIEAGEGVMLAVGHDSWILRSHDRGQTWKEVMFDAQKSEPLLGIAGPYDGKLFAFGAFGQFLTSKDRGVSWQRETLVVEGGVAPKPVVTDPADIFADAGNLGGGPAESHLNDMTRAGDGSLILVGERGLIARSTNNGQSWRVLPAVYSGSLYGVMTLPSGRLLTHGMRGNVFYSDDTGRSWQRSKVPVANSLHGGTLLPGGGVLLVGASNTLLRSRDEGASFVQVSKKGSHGVVAALAFENGELLKAGEGGLSLVRLGRGQ